MLRWLIVALFVSSTFATEHLTRVARYEPVVNLQINTKGGELSFFAYGTFWQFSIWLTDVHDGNTDHYHGVLRDAPKSYASFSFQPSFSAMIILNNDTLWVEHKHNVPGDSTLYVYRSSDVWFHPDAEFKCGHADHAEPSAIASREVKETRSEGTPTCAVWVDQFWLSNTTNPWFSTQSTYGLLNDVNAVYAAAGLHSFAFELMGKRNNAWTMNSQLNNMLNDFAAFAGVGNLGTNNMGLWLTGNNVGGLAWIGTGCSTSYPPYYRVGVAGLAASQRLWTVKTIAHELGHLRGAQHYTANQCPPNQNVNNCQCSVMSFCFPTMNTGGGDNDYFAQTSISQITASCP